MALRVNKQIGRRSYSLVYEATTPDGRVVALKQGHITKGVRYPILLHQACALSLLAGHLAIPSAYDWGRSQYFEYLTMDLLGISLADFVKERKQVDLRTTLLFLDQMLDALEHIHSRHLIHCDIKPDNFLFGLDDNSGRVRMVDYGLACYYRDPTTLRHHDLAEDQGFVGTGLYASRNSHLGLRLSRRDDLESRVYTIAFLLRGSLPWSTITMGTQKHKLDRTREKKVSYSGNRIFDGFSKQLYALERAFRRLFQDSGFLSVEGIDTTSLGNDMENTEENMKPPTKPKAPPASPPVSKGDYILIQILPRLAIEGTEDSDTSRWHDPSFSSPRWKFPAWPVLVLDVSHGIYNLEGWFVLSVLPLVDIPGGVVSEEDMRKRRLVRVGKALEGFDEDAGYRGEHLSRVVVPTPDWDFDLVYHSTLPGSVSIAISCLETTIEPHWKLDSVQLDRLNTVLEGESEHHLLRSPSEFSDAEVRHGPRRDSAKSTVSPLCVYPATPTY